MGEYKRVDDILAKIEHREGVLGLIEPKHHPSSKYKKSDFDKSNRDRPILKVGSKLVYSINRRGSVAGYALGVVLDWEGDSGGFWSNVTVIVQVTKVSNHEFDDMVGRLRHLSLGSTWYGWGSQPKFTPEEVNREDYGL